MAPNAAPQFSVPIAPGVNVHVPGTSTGSDLPGFNIGGSSKLVPGVGGIVSGTEALGKLAVDLTNPNWWVRVGEFTVGAILLTVGLSHLSGAGQAARRSTRTAERGARVAASFTPEGSAVNRASKATARVARRSRA